MTPQERLKEIAERIERLADAHPGPRGYEAFWCRNVDDTRFLLSLIEKLQADVGLAREGLKQGCCCADGYRCECCEALDKLSGAEG